jgi:hypothetical protein
MECFPVFSPINHKNVPKRVKQKTINIYAAQWFVHNDRMAKKLAARRKG